MKNILAIAVLIWSVVTSEAAVTPFVGNYTSWKYHGEQWDVPTTGEQYVLSKRLEKGHYTFPTTYLQTECYRVSYSAPLECSYTTNAWNGPYESYNYTTWDGYVSILNVASCQEIFYNDFGINRQALVRFTYREVNPETGAAGPLTWVETWLYVPKWSTISFDFPHVMFKDGSLTVSWFRF